MKRVVADSNILVSALEFGGKPMALLELAESGEVEIALSEAILTETLGVLRMKFHKTAEELRDRGAYLRAVSRMVEPLERVEVITVDATDNAILEAAVAADAEVIVSGDRHLLSLGSFRGIPVMRAAEFLERSRGR